MTRIETCYESRSFAENRLLQRLLACYLTMWTLSALAPVDRLDWLLENLLVFAFCGLMVSTYSRFRFSDLSYLFLFSFMMLHAIGAHYTYGQVPLGYWIRDSLGWNRNDFDRIAHFSYGLLFAYPIREIWVRTFPQSKPFWSYFMPVEFVLSSSAFFELLEAWIAQSVSPELANKYLGSQGDYFDAQNDIASALLGSVIAMSFNAWRASSSASASSRS